MESEPSSSKSLSIRDAMIKKIEDLTEDIVKDIAENKSLKIYVPAMCSWKKCDHTDRLKMKKIPGRLGKYKGRRGENLAVMVHLLAKIYRLVKSGLKSTRRELYYQEVDLLGSQVRLDRLVSRISCLLQVPQWDLNVLTSSKGLLFGSLVIYLTSSGSIDCSIKEQGVLVPQDLTGARLESNAQFVIVVEKDAIFQKLLSEEFHKRHGPLIMITGKGVPDANTRRLLHCIYEQLAIPIYGLFDADPYGIEILFTYKYGSRSMCQMNDWLTVPGLRWLGVHPSEVNLFGAKTIPLEQSDHRKISSLLVRPYLHFQPDILKEIELLASSNKKSEIEGIANLSTAYLTDVYIPMKIKSLKYI